MAELTDREKTAIIDTLAELSAQIVGIKNALKRDQTVAVGSLDEYIAKARLAVAAGWPASLPDLPERLRRG